MALTVIFGLVASTVLTLVVLPVIYYFCTIGMERFAPADPGEETGGVS